MTSETRVPSDEKMWANSAAMNPPPTMIEMLRQIADPHDGVAGVVLDAAIADRRQAPIAREPAAITTWSAVNSSPPSVRNV